MQQMVDEIDVDQIDMIVNKDEARFKGLKDYAVEVEKTEREGNISDEYEHINMSNSSAPENPWGEP